MAEKSLDKKIENLERRYGVESKGLDALEKEKNRRRFKKVKENFDDLIQVNYTEKEKSRVIESLSNKVNGYKLEGTLKEIANKELARIKYFDLLSKEKGNSLVDCLDSKLSKEEDKLKFIFKWNPSLLMKREIESLNEEGYLIDFMLDSLTGKSSRKNLEEEIVDKLRLYELDLNKSELLKDTREVKRRAEKLAERFDRRRFKEIKRNFDDLIEDEFEILGYRKFRIDYTEEEKERVLKNLRDKIGGPRGYRFGFKKRLVNNELGKVKHQNFLEEIERSKIREKGITNALADSIINGEMPENLMYYQIKWDNLEVSLAYKKAKKLMKQTIEDHITEIEERPENNEWVYT